MATEVQRGWQVCSIAAVLYSATLGVALVNPAPEPVADLPPFDAEVFVPLQTFDSEDLEMGTLVAGDGRGKIIFPIDIR